MMIAAAEHSESVRSASTTALAGDQLGQSMIESGELGAITYFRGWIFQDYAADPSRELGWRVRLAESGAGALGDLGSHIIDLSRHLCGELSAVSATLREPVDRDPPTPGVDDLVSMLVDFEGGTGGVIEASWALRGHSCDLGFDLVCEHGAREVLMGAIQRARHPAGDVPTS